ncbi:NAD(P)/FAD-dependent oxidoreductase [Synechococcus sp. BA-124 BA4]|uniref:phytoene desaturase family protein n=1 Tax=unclassified Synechococcus TaxID=2626047 RepID=UPI0018CDF3D2|nr:MULTISPECIES: NAD(P)/FAD-dependent oxidoreductase [unclassified Synechococcus]MEA5400988.1 NAD(P)/FAD-dependent oxidoreductase [Synechococcus sp. BA-124 BA4]QPN56777.1 FAD-dependent oxidoreductase [Synechococcus sp. CBW1107]CAK6696352.1 Phytoene desaturase (lycopene-forming) [Synechococcus sp. CBW1107]
MSAPPSSCDLVVIGSGLGGLSCGGLAALHGLDVVVLEAHDRAGGAAHGFERRGFRFESGPSLWSGLGRWPSSNPLAQVLRALGETVPVATYHDWGLLLPEGPLRIGVGPDPFRATVRELRGVAAADEWSAFMAWLQPYSEAALALPLLAMRPGLGMAAVLGARRSARLARLAPKLAALGGAFGPMARRHLRDPFLLHWVDLLCFLISGLPMDQTSAAAMATLFADWFDPGACLEYPLGGSPAVVAALVRGLQRHGGALHTSAPVAEITLEDGAARGVRLVDGRLIHARRGVVSNASPWDTLALLPPGSPHARWRHQRESTPACASFLHLHMGLRGEGLQDLPVHHVWVGDWERGIGAERNMLVLSMPSLLDPSLAPEGHHVLHGYTPANEPWELWRDLEPGTEAYESLKRDRCALFRQVLDGIVPDLEERLVLELHGTPRTHQRFLRVHQGSYGPALGADQGVFPSGSTPIEGLSLCGAGVFPGIGVPPVAVSGAMAAHGFVPIARHRALLESLDLLRP